MYRLGKRIEDLLFTLGGAGNIKAAVGSFTGRPAIRELMPDTHKTALLALDVAKVDWIEFVSDDPRVSQNIRGFMQSLRPKNDGSRTTASAHAVSV